MLKGFKEFVLRGNALDLAIAVIIGTAFNKVVSSLVQDVLMPFISITAGRIPDFSSWKLGIISIGNFLNATINFLVIATTIYFFVVTPLNTLKRRENKSKQEASPAPPEPSEEIKLLREIADLLRTSKAK
ncbi:large conductance mechanosensitive channel protein MscL [Atrimonas thermophila]|uniref:large conductance mechanosensitive channel protein MscL n=1 Tax=Atrimonas thermophila TaxID=3064161 RepID=UPI00399CA04E